GDQRNTHRALIGRRDFAIHLKQLALHGVDDNETLRVSGAQPNRFRVRNSRAVFVIRRNDRRLVFERTAAGAYDVCAGLQLPNAKFSTIVGQTFRNAADGRLRGIDVDVPVRDADGVIVDHRPGDGRLTAHDDLVVIVIRALVRNFEWRARQTWTRLPEFGLLITDP